jgi:putative transposase
MSRLPRPVAPQIPLHIIQRGNNRQRCFFGENDYLIYLDLLKQAARRAHCQVHAYVLMTNHVHLLVTPSTADGPGNMMKALGERYVRYVNRRYERTGSLWEGRFRSCLVQEDSYLLACHRYIELNPVRAQMVSHPYQYPWSSYRRNAHGEPNNIITPHPIYCELAQRPTARESSYRHLFTSELPTRVLNKVRRATNGNYAVGSKAFTDQLAELLGRAVVPRQGGRPARSQLPGILLNK